MVCIVSTAKSLLASPILFDLLPQLVSMTAVSTHKAIFFMCSIINVLYCLLFLMVCVLITYWNTHTLIYISVQSYGKKTNRGVLVFLESGRISIF